MKGWVLLAGVGVLLAITSFTSLLQSTSCPVGYLPPRLQGGESARVVPGGSPNRVRAEPSLDGAFIGQINPGTQINVLEGPVCNSDIAWWRVNAGDLTGWTAEGLPPANYFLEPIIPEGIDRAGTAVAQATLSIRVTELAMTQASAATQIAQATTEMLSAVMTGTAQALITPSATPTVPPPPTLTPTPTITPTFPPLMALNQQREWIYPENVPDLVTLAVLPVPASTVHFASDGSQVLLNGEFAYHLPSLQAPDTFAGFPLSLGRVVSYSPDMRYVLFVPYDGGNQPYYLWDTQSSEGVAKPLDMLPRGNSVAMSSGRNYLIAVASGEGYGAPEPPQLYIYDIEADRMLQVLDNPAAFTADIVFNASASRVASTGSAIRLIEIDRPQWRIPADGWSNGGIAYRPQLAGQGEQLAYGAGAGVILLDLGRGTSRSYAITGGSTARTIRFSPDGRLMAIYSMETHGDFFAPPDRFNLFDVETGELLMDTGEYGRGFAFSPDGTLLVVGATDGTTRILGLP